MSKTLKPFFARFLETEENPDLRAQSAVKAGASEGWPPIGEMTKKYPSDGDDCYQSGVYDWDAPR